MSPAPVHDGFEGCVLSRKGSMREEEKQAAHRPEPWAGNYSTHKTTDQAVACPPLPRHRSPSSRLPTASGSFDASRDTPGESGSRLPLAADAAMPPMPAKMRASAAAACHMCSTSSPATSTPQAKEVRTATPHHTPVAAARPMREMEVTAQAADSTNRQPETTPHAENTWRAGIQERERWFSDVTGELYGGRHDKGHHHAATSTGGSQTRGGTMSRKRPDSATPSASQ